ncbi:hypothetical protein NL676_005281 [Syzygium grande]|nr:hypothetical protein NL676_005281 [Syzygium grande]
MCGLTHVVYHLLLRAHLRSANSGRAPAQRRSWMAGWPPRPGQLTAISQNLLRRGGDRPFRCQVHDLHVDSPALAAALGPGSQADLILRAVKFTGASH